MSFSSSIGDYKMLKVEEKDFTGIYRYWKYFMPLSSPIFTLITTTSGDWELQPQEIQRIHLNREGTLDFGNPFNFFIDPIINKRNPSLWSSEN